ncbi:TVG1020335 [Thermoplasma volcanium GSS1]|uniref:TVG1020335 protein n=1 Tax=Thermoplasma volcanium (strain ATCC 51530 / DSM 4299 / JCM 9571 / NBRC 15438 / GSS1) TaxID=273116 RepID=Q97A13_THEVO|nr:TVG1020335 [Thermoplasma volcanium GSS1]
MHFLTFIKSIYNYRIIIGYVYAIKYIIEGESCFGIFHVRHNKLKRTPRYNMYRLAWTVFVCIVRSWRVVYNNKIARETTVYIERDAIDRCVYLNLRHIISIKNSYCRNN